MSFLSVFKKFCAWRIFENRPDDVIFEGSPSKASKKTDFWVSKLIRCSNVIFSLFLFNFMLLVCTSTCIQAEEQLPEQSGIAILITDQKNNTIYSENENIRMIPASIIKLYTSLMAIHFLGEEYHFKTEFYIDQNQNLILKGFGNPLFTSESISEAAGSLAGVLKKKEIHIKNILLDHSLFEFDIMIPGVESSSYEPYNSGVVALGANFNTVNFSITPSGQIISGEEETPVLPFVFDQIRKSGQQKGRIILTKKDSRLYAGHLMHYFLNSFDIKSTGVIQEGMVSPDDRILYTYVSEFNLMDIIEKLMRYSNNYIANQLFIASGVSHMKQPGHLNQSKLTASWFGKNQLDLEDVTIIEGSGISRDNRITAKNMMGVLNHFSPYKHLLRKKGKDLYKTGTLTDVRTRCGFYRGNDEKDYAYVILINGPNAVKQMDDVYNRMIHLVSSL